MNLRHMHSSQVLKTPSGVKLVITNPEDFTEHVGAMDLHPLTVEDVRSGRQRTKHEAYSKYDFLTVRELRFSGAELVDEQVSIILNDSDIVVVGEGHSRALNNLLHRVVNDKDWKPMGKGTGRIAHALLDMVVDGYIAVAEELERISASADDDVDRDDPDAVKTIHFLRKSAIAVRGIVRPFRELCNSVMVGNFMSKDENMDVYMRDLYDHVVRVSENMDTLRDFAYSMSEMYASNNANKMNDTVRILTVITTVFTPIMFLSSVYGMNFKGIPEIRLEHGYAAFWGVSALLTVLQLWFYRRKRWI